MGSDNRYITLDSGAFGNIYPQNNALDFTNLLFPPLDNRAHDLELCIIDISFVGIQGMPACLDVECDLIDPYQNNDGMSQTIATILPQPKMRVATQVANDWTSPPDPTYYRMRETHSEFDRFTTIRVRVRETFHMCGATQPKTTFVTLPHTQIRVVRPVIIRGRYGVPIGIRRKGYVPTPMKVGFQRAIVRLHIRRVHRPGGNEANQ
jgi:hypothetical protein